MHTEAGPEAAFNMSGLQTQLGNIVVATEYMDIALAKNSAAVKHQQRLISGPIPGLCPKEFGGNYRLMQARPAAMMLWSLSEADSEVNPSLLVPFSPLWVGVFSLATIGILATVIGSTLVFFGLFMSFWAPAHRCEKCAEVACRRCRPELKYLQVCERCLLVSVQGQLVEPVEFPEVSRPHAGLILAVQFLAPARRQVVHRSAMSPRWPWRPLR